MKREVKVEEMLLSIIIPVYQVEKYIDECLKSVIKAIKEVDKVEVLLLDDGSKDGSALVCKQYEQEYALFPFRKLRSFKNKTQWSSSGPRKVYYMFGCRRCVINRFH